MNKEAYEKQLINRIIKSIERHGGKDIFTSIVLTGSFGRNEPTYVISSNGNVVLKSDVEIALIFPTTKHKRNISKIIDAVSSEFDEDLNLMPIKERRVKKLYNFNYSLLVPKYKTIFTYDLFNGSYTIWGEQIIERKNIDLAQVDKYEAKRLVANRIGELVYMCEYKINDKNKFLIAQWKGKLLLAIASAWLLIHGKYVSSYHGQYCKICDSKKTLCELFGSDFIRDYIKVFTFLREGGDFCDLPDASIKNYVNIIDDHFNFENVGSPKVNSISRKLKYLVKYIKTGCHYGCFKFEENIIESLIVDYYDSNERIVEDAKTWHAVLY